MVTNIVLPSLIISFDLNKLNIQLNLETYSKVPEYAK